jgi:uncharacterized membrane protein YjjB (DUF3815 family)
LMVAAGFGWGVYSLIGKRVTEPLSATAANFFLGITGHWIAILADTGATVLVTLNALRLLFFRPSGSPEVASASINHIPDAVRDDAAATT